ncbi:MAG: hypothetical protein KME22_19715 [Hassallia sp. WJT32-NPBG1]|nr:hypothetical protein [Hassallia sp. WJT32-NPBG1]
MLLSIKTKLDISSLQTPIRSKDAGIARFISNWRLARWQSLYKDGFKPDYRIVRTFFNNEVKLALPWIKQKGICQKIAQYAFEHLVVWQVNFAGFMVRKSSSFLPLLPLLPLPPLPALNRRFWLGRVLGTAFKNFFAGRAKYPNFKRKNQHHSFTIHASGKLVLVGGTKIKLPTIGWVKTFEELPHTSTKTFTPRLSDD